MEATKQANDVRHLIGSERHGMLCTLSRKMAGWPFGSIVPYSLTYAGEPVMLISEIAEHTRNLRDDARASLLISESKAANNVQAGARATLMGYAIPVPGPFVETARRRYLELFPDSESYFAVHDFTLFQIRVTDIRYIGGFGDIHWLKGDDVVDRSADFGIDPLARHSRMICDHMNQDHSDALLLFAERFGGVTAESARMIHADSEGFDVIAVNQGTYRHLRMLFPTEVVSPEDARKVMVEMVKQARSGAA